MYELHVPRGEHPKLFWGSVKYLRTDFLHVNIWKRRVSYTGNHIDLRISEMAFLLCAEPFAINISVHDYVYISLCPVILEMWLHKRCKGPNNFAKLKSLERRKWYLESHFRTENKLVQPLGMEHGNNADLINIVSAISII